MTYARKMAEGVYPSVEKLERAFAEVIEACAQRAEGAAHPERLGGCDHAVCVNARDAAARIRSLATDPTP